MVVDTVESVEAAKAADTDNPAGNSIDTPTDSPSPESDKYDTELLDLVLALVLTEPEHKAFLLEAKQLVRQSSVYNAFSQYVMETDIKLTSKLEVAFCVGFLCGSGCTVTAIDHGYVEGFEPIDELYPEGAD
jgi:hypothetical protein